VWHAIDARRVWPMLTAGLAGVPLGTLLVTRLDPAAFRLGMDVLLLGFSAFMLLGRLRPRLAWGGRTADAAVGLGGGVLGGLAGLSGPLPTMWATLRGWGKDERRGVFQAFNLTVLGAALASHAAAVPGTLAGARLGAQAYRRLSDRRFHEVVLGLLGLSGFALVWTSLA
jgi:uncharacterized protein